MTWENNLFNYSHFKLAMQELVSLIQLENTLLEDRKPILEADIMKKDELVAYIELQQKYIDVSVSKKLSLDEKKELLMLSEKLKDLSTLNKDLLEKNIIFSNNVISSISDFLSSRQIQKAIYNHLPSGRRKFDVDVSSLTLNQEI